MISPSWTAAYIASLVGPRVRERSLEIAQGHAKKDVLLIGAHAKPRTHHGRKCRMGRFAGQGAPDRVRSIERRFALAYARDAPRRPGGVGGHLNWLVRGSSITR